MTSYNERLWCKCSDYAGELLESLITYCTLCCLAILRVCSKVSIVCFEPMNLIKFSTHDTRWLTTNFLSMALWVIFYREGNIVTVVTEYIMDQYMTQHTPRNMYRDDSFVCEVI